MFRPLLLVAIIALLALAAVACASDDTGPTVTQTSSAGATASASVRATPVEYAQALRAVAAPDQEAYQLSVAGRVFVQATCLYDADENVVSCDQLGFYYVLEPPLADDEVSCVAGLPAAGGTPEFVLCTGPNVGESKFYVIENVSPAPQAS